MEQEIRYCTAADGVRIAYATAGSGAPLIKVANWFGHLEFDWRSPIWRHWLEAFSRDHLLVRYDGRGCGLSDRDPADLSIDACMDDLDTVAAAAGGERFALVGWSQGAIVAIAYAVAHPERVSHLVLFGGTTGGAMRPGRMTPEQIEEWQAMATLAKAGWERDTSPIRQLLTNTLIPDATPEEARWFTEASKVSVTGQMAGRFLETFLQWDVIDLLPRVTAQTLVLHSTEDAGVPFEHARVLASSIPGARLAPIDSHNHFLLESDPGWPTFLREVRRFLGTETRDDTPGRRLAAGADRSMATILFTDIEGSTPLTQRLGDAGAQELVRAHNTAVRRALGLHAGMEIKHTGDGIMASFASASRALECAVEIQTALAARPELPRVRIGLNTGEPIAEDGDLFGTTVQLARRICDHAEPGEVLVSDVVRQLAAGKGFLFADAGVAALKGFDEPIQSYALRWREGA